MKVNVALRHLAVMTAVVLFLASCGKDYCDVIPKNSPAIACFDVPRMASETGMNLKDIDGILPFAAGADFSRPVYAFVSPNSYYGMVFAVDDAGKIEEATGASGVFSQKEKSGGLHWAVWKNSWQMAWNDDALLVIGPVAATERSFMRRTVGAMFNGSEGISQSGLFAKLESMEGSAKLVARLSSLPGFIGKLMSLQVSGDADADSVVLQSRISFSPRKIVAENLMKMSDGSDVPKAAGIKPYCGTLDGEHMAADTKGLMLLGLDGQQLVRRIHADKSMRPAVAAMNADIDADRILGSVNGDAAVAFGGIDTKGNMMLSLVAALKDASFMNDVPIWKKDSPKANLQKSVDGYWTYVSGGKRFEFGVRKDGKLECRWGGAGNACGAKPQSPVSYGTPQGKLCHAVLFGEKLAEMPVLKGLFGGKLSEFLKRYPVISYSLSDISRSEMEFSRAK